MQATNTQLNAILQQRLGGIALEQYAELLADRERLLDEGKITKGWFGIKGDKDWVTTMLEGLASRHKVAHVPGDFDRSNRVAEWDQLIASDPAARAAWGEVYSRALVKMNNVDVYSAEGDAHVQRVKGDDDLMLNPFRPIAKRKAGISTALKQQKEAALVSAFQAVKAGTQPAAAGAPAAAPGAPRIEEDPVLFPGERLSKLSDFVRLQKAAQSGDFMGALAREGIDAGYYGQMSIKFAQRMQAEPMLAALHAKMLMSH